MNVTPEKSDGTSRLGKECCTAAISAEETSDFPDEMGSVSQSQNSLVALGFPPMHPRSSPEFPSFDSGRTQKAQLACALEALSPLLPTATPVTDNIYSSRLA
jgi:hypothetical protein